MLKIKERYNREVLLCVLKDTLEGARLINAALYQADLHQIRLAHADLQGANLGGATLTGALYDTRTRCPDSFAPQRHGAVMLR